MVKALADRGANLEATDDIGWTPIFSAARSGHLEVVKELADRGASLEATDNKGQTPISLAAKRRQWEVVKELADRGANLEATDNDGWTPIFSAARDGLTTQKPSKMTQKWTLNLKNRSWRPLGASWGVLNVLGAPRGAQEAPKTPPRGPQDAL